MGLDTALNLTADFLFLALDLLLSHFLLTSERDPGDFWARISHRDGKVVR